MCKQYTELNVLICCLSRVRKRTIYDGLGDHGRVSFTPAELSSLCHFGVEKFFVRLIFIVVGHRRNIFNDENFPIYGSLYSLHRFCPCMLLHVLYKVKRICVELSSLVVWSRVTCHRSQVTSHRSQVTGHMSQVTGHGSRLLLAVTDCALRRMTTPAVLVSYSGTSLMWTPLGPKYLSD